VAERRPPRVAPPRQGGSASQRQSEAPQRPDAERREPPRTQAPRASGAAGARPQTPSATQRSGKVVVRGRRRPATRASMQTPPEAPARREPVTAPKAPWERVRTSSLPATPVSTRMQDRLKERKRTERRRSGTRIAGYAAIASAIGMALWGVIASPLFALDEGKVEVSGVTAEIDPAAVQAIVDERAGDSLITLNVRGIAADLSAVTGVRDATVERVWPQGLRVTLVARHPVAAIPSGNQFILLDADAVEVGTVDAAPADLPIVTVPLGEQRVLDAVVTVVRSLPVEVLARVQGIGAQTEDSVQFTLRDGPRVEWGSSEDSALKAQVLTVMLDSGQASGVSVVDVSAPTLPITRTEG